MFIAFELITYYADGFKGEQDGAKEERKIFDLSNSHAVIKRQRLSKDIIKYDRKPGEHNSVCDR